MENGQLLFPYDAVRSALGGIGRTTLYALIDAGEIQRVKIGNRAFVTAKSVAGYVGRLTAQTSVVTDAQEDAA